MLVCSSRRPDRDLSFPRSTLHLKYVETKRMILIFNRSALMWQQQMCIAKTGFTASPQSIFPSLLCRNYIYHTSVKCTVGTQYRNLWIRECRVSNTTKREERIIVQVYDFMLYLTWQRSGRDAFLPFSTLTFDCFPSHSLPGQSSSHTPRLLSFSHTPQAVIHTAMFSMTMLSCMDLGSNDGNWADLIVSGAKEDILTPHSPFPLLIYSFSQPLLRMWLIGKPVQFLKTGFHRNLKQSNSLLCWEAFQTPSFPLSSNPFILYLQYSPILSPVDMYSGISPYQSHLLNRLNWLNRQNFFFFNLFYAILMKLTHTEAEYIQDKKVSRHVHGSVKNEN